MEKSLVDLMQEKTLGHQNVPDLCDERRGFKRRGGLKQLIRGFKDPQESKGG